MITLTGDDRAPTGGKRFPIRITDLHLEIRPWAEGYRAPIGGGRLPTGCERPPINRHLIGSYAATIGCTGLRCLTGGNSTSNWRLETSNWGDRPPIWVDRAIIGSERCLIGGDRTSFGGKASKQRQDTSNWRWHLWWEVIELIRGETFDWRWQSSDWSEDIQLEAMELWLAVTDL